MSITSLPAADGERHVLDPARPLVRESLVWVLMLPEHGLGALAYTWVDGEGRAGALGTAFGPGLDEQIFELTDGEPVGDDAAFTDWQVAGLRSRQAEPFGRAHVTFAGDALSMDFTFAPFHEPYGYATHPGGFPAFYADERYEQGGRARGTITVYGTELEIDAFCHHDHSWGARDWGACSHFKWFNFLAGDMSINVMDLQALGDRWIRGYVHRDGVTAEIRSADFRHDFDDEFFHTDIEVELQDSAGRTTRARTTAPSAARAQYPINPRLTLIDEVGEAEIDGVAGVSYCEMAWPPDYIADRQRGS